VLAKNRVPKVSIFVCQGIDAYVFII
jgi:hypothetical protein